MCESVKYQFDGRICLEGEEEKSNSTEETVPPFPIQFKNAILALAQVKTVSNEKLVIHKRLFHIKKDYFLFHEFNYDGYNMNTRSVDFKLIQIRKWCFLYKKIRLFIARI